MKVLYCTTGLMRGGAEAQAVELACQMKRRGHEILFVSLTRIETDWRALAQHKIKVESLGMQRGRPSLSAFFRLIRIWKTFQPDVVHSHMFHANIAVRLARPFSSRARVICTAHSINEGGILRTLAYRLTDWLAGITTNVSRAAVAAYAAKGIAPRARLAFVPNGIDLSTYDFPASTRLPKRQELGWAPGEFVWLAVGRLAEPKDYPTMIAAFTCLKPAAGAPWRLVIAGDGSLRAEIERQIDAAGLGKQIQLLGPRNDVPALMNAADAYVMSSAWEGLPMVLLEAGAARLPVVATRVGGNSEIVVHGKTGLVVQARSPAELARALEDMMKLTFAERAEMGSQARVFVAASYGIDQVVSKWERGYSNLAALREPASLRPAD